MQRRGINDITEAELLAVLNDPDFAEFDRLIEDFADICNAIKKFSDHQQSLIEKTTSRLGHLDSLVNKFFDNPEKFKRQIENLKDLEDMADALVGVSSELPDRLLEKVCSDPDHVKKLMEKVLHDPAEFKRTFEDGTALTGYAKVFPDYAEPLFAASRMLEDPEEFRRMIVSWYDLIETAKLFPHHAEELIAKVLTDPVNFRHVISDSLGLRESAKQFPQHADALIAKILDDPEEFKRVFKSEENFDFIETAKQFSNQPIMQAGSREKALAMVVERAKNLSQVGIAASTLGQSKRDKDKASPFSMFPKDVLIEIAKHTADPGVLSKEEKHKKAHESYVHPSERKPKK